MAENKRFTIGKIKHFVNDNETNYCYVLELEGDAEHLCILLNELVDENKQLKQEIETLQEQLTHFDIGDV